MENDSNFISRFWRKHKQNVGICLLVGILLIIAVYMTWLAVNESRKRHDTIYEVIGHHIIFEGDTVDVIRYDNGETGIPDGYMLSNGMKVDRRVVEKCKKID